MVSVAFVNPDNPITPDKAIIHDNEAFRVQWSAFNVGASDLSAFLDRLVVTSIPEGCPGSDDVDHDVVFDSDVDGDTADYTEEDLSAGKAGALMQPSVGPFPVGSYRLTVTLASDISEGDTTFRCIEIVPAV
ncbi:MULTISPECIES: hypothetical protein [unclassified Mesorhizobium]|uniref:hypothetical protein n=1 Tax=unclassified Mesorhizobium TaxID=325217 RepID=UPI000FDC1C53|nr:MULTISPECIES: hypothetical protein [unclassified Mesorhizobium]TGQ15956.1 hypothetical protein EN862_000095 [Mesorhizobium sp. M2E.F.Ca.ET.219.01.1.1]TGT77948.1 hypothetical protein EN809_010460 [Mesorhizobium sp. M2E.F.Ca.ET.166.01.1.1]TGW04058.1 hypothetical protein EN797_010460 [Mesorhizobium sp. M2E.F.Ca.ET.154.01.1.1]